MAKSNSSSKGGNTVSVVSAIAEPVAKQLGLDLWDVRFEKEAPAKPKARRASSAPRRHVNRKITKN